MRRSRYLLASSVLAAAAIWACGNDYTADPSAPAADAGPAPNKPDTAPPDLSPANPPGITLDKIKVARGETASVPYVVTRAGHTLALDIVANNVPVGITVAPAKLASGETGGTLRVTAATTATEGTLTIGLALLDGNDEIAEASAIVEIGPLRAGSLDPGFGSNGFVDLDLPRSLFAFDSAGALYVLASSGLTRWSKDGVHDATYGPISNLPATFTPTAMTVTDNGQVHLAGYSLGGGGSTATIVRSTTDGTHIDPSFGALGTASVPTPASPNGQFSAFGLVVTPTAIYAASKLDKDGTTGQPGATWVSRLSLAGAGDTTYGNSGFIPIAIDPAAPKLAFFDPIGVDHFVLALGDVLSGTPFLRLYEGENKLLTARYGDYGLPTALAFDGTSATSLVTRADDAGTTLLRIGDAGVDPSFGPIAFQPNIGVHGITVDDGRLLVSGCTDTSASWSRYFGDGGLDPEYRSGTTPEIDCVLAARLTEKYLYIVGQHGTPGKLRIARLIR